MAWVDISESTYKKVHTDSYNSAPSGDFYLVLQYDDAATTQTSAKLRFVLKKSTSSWYTDTFHLLLNPTTSSRSLYELKDDTNSNTKGWPYYGAAFTVTKAYSAAKFTIPAFWSCNDGAHNTAHTATDFYNQYNDSAWRGKNMRCSHAATDIAINSSKTVATAVGTGSVSVVDNYNNSYTANGTRGAAGTNNGINGAKLWYGLGTSSGSYSTKAFAANATTATSGAISITPTTSATRTIYAAVTTDGVYNDTDTGWKSFTIKQYLAPNNPTSITLDDSSLRNGRLTIKQDWKYNWSGASRINASCPIKGYRYCLEKQSAGSATWSKVALKNSSGDALSGKMSGSNEYDTTSTSVTFSPSQSGIVAGDKVRLRVKAFTKYGNNNDGTILANGSYATSAESTVQNAGVMQVCVKKGTKLQWTEGVVHVYIKKNNKLQWVEADIVKVYKSKAWKEST